MLIYFAEGGDFCGLGLEEVAYLYYHADGPGTYQVGDQELSCPRDENGVPLGPPPGQPPFIAQAWRPQGDEWISGTGVIELGETYLDKAYTHGAVDVVFPDGTRLLADFLAPLCITE